MFLDRTDDELMLAMKAGNQLAFRELFRRHNAMILGFCLRFFRGQRSRAEDVSQEIWMKLIRYARTYSQENKFKAWVRQIARNSCLREIQKDRILFETKSDIEDDFQASFDLEDALLKRQSDDIVRAAIEELPEAQRIAILFWIDGLSTYEDIARELNCRVGAVKSLLFRAKQNLFDRLKESA